MSRCGAAVMPRCLLSARARRKLPRNMGREKMRRLTALLLAAGLPFAVTAQDAASEATCAAQAELAKRLPLDDPRDERSEEHTSELQSLMSISYAVFCLKKKQNKMQPQHTVNQ